MWHMPPVWKHFEKTNVAKSLLKHPCRVQNHMRENDIEILPLKHTHTQFLLIIIINNQTQQNSLYNIFEIKEHQLHRYTHQN